MTLQTGGKPIRKEIGRTSRTAERRLQQPNSRLLKTGSLWIPGEAVGQRLDVRKAPTAMSWTAGQIRLAFTGSNPGGALCMKDAGGNTPTR